MPINKLPAFPYTPPDYSNYISSDNGQQRNHFWAASLAEGSTNVQATQCLGKPLTLGWYRKAHPNSAELTDWMDYGGKTCRGKCALPTTWWCITETQQFLRCFRPLVRWGQPTGSQSSHHPLNKPLKAAHSSRMNSTVELYSQTFLRRGISGYLSACISVYLPNFLLQSRLPLFSLASTLTRLS